MTLAKICGIQDVQSALVAAEAGAALVGFVFVPVRRQIEPAVAGAILQSIRNEMTLPPAGVGLFVNESPEAINSIANEVQLDMVQLSGDETADFARHIDCPVIKAVRLKPDMSLDDGRRIIEPYLRFAVAVLIDSHVPGQWGGTGQVGDWETAAVLADEYPVILAGGLTPDNVEQAIEQVCPAVVDVSSGVETENRKDARKIRAFLENASSAAARVTVSGPCAQLQDLIFAARGVESSVRHERV